MTMQETSVLLGILKTAYPRFYTDITPETLGETVELWHAMLSDVTLELARPALFRLIATSKFPPSIAEMRKSVADIKYEALPDAGEAWGEVNRAIRKYGYYQQEKALESMSETTRMIVRRMGWRDLCTSQNDMADRAHFLKIYEAMCKTTGEQRQLPDALKEKIALIGKDMPGTTGGKICQVNET